MNFVANKDENQKDEGDDAMSKIKGSMGAGQGIVKCRNVVMGMIKSLKYIKSLVTG